MTTGILKMKTANLAEKQKLFFSTRAVVFFLAQTLAESLPVGTLVIRSMTSTDNKQWPGSFWVPTVTYSCSSHTQFKVQNAP